MDHKFIKDRDIVLFSSQPWDAELGSNFKDMALELSKLNRVLFINRALNRVSLLKGKNNPSIQTRLASIKTGTGELTKLQPNLWIHNPRTILESINWIPFPAIHDFLNKVNNKRLAKQINKIIHQLEFTNVILINDNDFIRGRYLKQLVHCSDYIFYKRDYLLGVSYFQRHGPRLESGILREADMVVTNSEYLARRAKKYNRNSYDMGQGCDIKNSIAADVLVPEDIRHIKKPVIGYTGYISAWRIDIMVLKYIAEQLPECSLALIGPVDVLFNREEVKHLRNIHFLGTRSSASLPGYIKYFDICMNPQVLNKITMGNYPRKVDEYLAMGKPVVATATETMKLFEGYCMLCATKTEFVENIKHILYNPGLYTSEEEQQRRTSFALSHNWTNSIGRLGDAYFDAKSKPVDPMPQVKDGARQTPSIQILATCFLIAYLLFIFIKFLFY